MRYRTMFAATTLAAATTFSVGLTASAAPTTYEDAVLANNPYVFYRLNETSGTTADDTSANNRDGTYVGDPTLGVAGFGSASDTAVSFSEDHLSAPINSHGSSVPNSTYEFILKADDPNFTQAATIFGLINAAATGRTNTQSLAIEANAENVNGANAPGTGRLWLRDEESSQLWANFDMGSLLDGNYHHFATTIDMSAATAAEKVTFYLDGVALETTAAAESAGLADVWLDWTVDAALAGRNIRDTSVDRFAPITVDEASLYTTTLSGAQILANAQAAGIPEPTSIGILGLAGAGLLIRRRR